MNDPAQLWADPRLVYTVAVFAVALLLASIYLFRRRRREGRQAGVICLMLSVILHALLIFLVPYLGQPSGGSSTVAQQPPTPGVDATVFSSFEASMTLEEISGDDDAAMVAPLPVSALLEILNAEVSTPDEPPDKQPLQAEPEAVAAEPLQALAQDSADDLAADIDAALDSWFNESLTTNQPDHDVLAVAQPNSAAEPSPQATAPSAPEADHPVEHRGEARAASTAVAPAATVVGDLREDFANRVGTARQEALDRTGGNADTEAAVAAALKFLADAQRSDGSWDPIASGAGRERAPLGMNRGGAGRHADTAITGLALLTLIGAGNTQADGQYADNVYRGLSYLIRKQKPDGSLAGDAEVYAANYSHGMAALAMCEAAAITGDPSAVEAARRAMSHTIRMQHPSTGGWRYTPGDPGDLSQAGWQAMVLDAGHRAGIPASQPAVNGVRTFLRSVRAGSGGGLACYRPGEAASRTMTAEALATRLLIGEHVPASELAEAERYLLQQPPGSGQDNYYYWYYATLALHQVQNESWQRWNQSLQSRLLATQRSDGSWPTTSMWGGYGGSVYTTSMAALCLETYYRHSIRSDRNRVAGRASPLR